MAPRKPAPCRLDERLVKDGLAPDLAEARALVLAGRVVVGPHRCDKAGTPVRADVAVRLAGEPASRYVSRGGLKLEAGLAALGLDVAGVRALDVGASTGGFTDCLLQHGAAGVVAVDVGYGLLADRLRKDPRVTVRERTHARALLPHEFACPVDLAVMDVSFTGARALLPAVMPLLGLIGRVLVLVKPQFEAARADVGPGGVVWDDAVRAQTVDAVAHAAGLLGLREVARVDCAVPGPAGNREVFLLLARVPLTTPR
ncbi:MAG: TlyA family RNA methyltransferase [Myxococcales bacterium]|nr:TlyA family RNA methyltransferase [Myxococcales bacterium]